MFLNLTAEGEQVASSVTQIWYSLRLSEQDFQLVIRTLQELIEASSLEELTQGRMKMPHSHLQRITEVWCTWIQLSSRGGDWITEARRRRFEHPHEKDGMDMYLKEIPKEHKKSASEWFANGILLSKESREVLPRENFTLTGSDFSLNNNKGAFSYILQMCVLPFCGWDYKEVRRWGYSACILKMFSGYISHVLQKCALRLANGKVKFHFLLCNCMDITPCLPAGWKYDRVTTSNIADFVPLTILLDTFKPFLNLSNPFSVIITEFQNWVGLTNLKVEAMERAHSMPRGDSFRKKVLEDTNNPFISNSRGFQGFVEYHDHSAEFIQFLRASLLRDEIPSARNRRRKWVSVADYDGMIARNFLRCRNRIVPSRWMLNCRRVTILTGYERAVEWIIKSK